MRVVVAVLILTLSGCASAPVEDIEPVVEECAADGVCGQDAIEVGGRDLRTDLLSSDVLDAPEWNVGDVFEQHLFFGASDVGGSHIQTVVISNQGGYQIATPDIDSARNDAVYDYPILGDVPENLSPSWFGSDWDSMYDWPLSDGKIWTGTIEGLINWNSYSFTDFELTMTSSYEAAIDTPKGDFPGFEIRAVTADGDLLALYNYVPAIGWFSHLWMYDIETDDPEDIMFHAMSMGTSTDYQGTYYVSEAETVIEEFYGAFPNPTGPIQGQPVHEFRMPEAERMMGIVVPIAVGGRTEIQLVDPEGSTASYQYQQFDQNGPGFDVNFYDDGARPGGWQVRVLGAGIATGGLVWLSSVDTVEFTM